MKPSRPLGTERCRGFYESVAFEHPEDLENRGRRVRHGVGDPLDGAVDRFAAEVDLVFACGPNMQRLFEALPQARRGAWAPTSDGIVAVVTETVRCSQSPSWLLAPSLYG